MMTCPWCVADFPDRELTFYILRSAVVVGDVVMLGTAACPECRVPLEAGRAGDLVRRAPGALKTVLTDGELADAIGPAAAVCDRLGRRLTRWEHEYAMGQISARLAEQGRPAAWIEEIAITTNKQQGAT